MLAPTRIASSKEARAVELLPREHDVGSIEQWAPVVASPVRELGVPPPWNGADSLQWYYWYGIRMEVRLQGTISLDTNETTHC